MKRQRSYFSIITAFYFPNTNNAQPLKKYFLSVCDQRRVTKRLTDLGYARSAVVTNSFKKRSQNPTLTSVWTIYRSTGYISLHATFFFYLLLLHWTHVCCEKASAVLLLLVLWMAARVFKYRWASLKALACLPYGKYLIIRLETIPWSCISDHMLIASNLF